MINVKLRIASIEKFSGLLKTFDSIFTTCIITPEETLFGHNCSQSYHHYRCRNSSVEGLETILAVRIPTYTLEKLATEGDVNIQIYQNEVTVTFSKYSFKCPLQYDLLDSFSDKLKLISDLKNYERINMNGILQINRVARSLGKELICQDGNCFISTPAFMVFKKADVSNFCVSAKQLNMLFKYSEYVYNAGSYLAVQDEEIAIVITKMRSSLECDAEYAMKQKSYYGIKFDMSDMLYLLKKIKITDGLIKLDFNQKKCIFDNDRVVYDTSLNVSDVKVNETNKTIEAPDFLDLEIDDLLCGDDNPSVLDLESIKNETSIPSVVIPTSIVKVLSALYDKTCTLFVKRDFILIKCSELNIIFKGIKGGLASVG